ncbi:MAG TPA: F0F1 ATP synthase subunit A [Xanthobacteraceae bacterium]|nr:F0F1 ATP synthase subunit A [Xanthobacteraceae bacterium]
MDPIHQFNITKFYILGHIGGHEIAITNSALFMFAAVAIIIGGMLIATARRSLVPGRAQSVVETSYEFVADMVRQSAGESGMKFFPLVFTLFSFILVLNMFGMIPGLFAVTSHIVVTVFLSLVVFLTVVIYGFWHNGFKFLKLFVPSGVPVYILPLIVAIEVMSFFSRPISHSVRLFANILAGHITLKVFAGFVALLGGLGIAGWVGALLPLALTVALTALELLVAFLQAYVFAILTCIYLNDAIHPGH